MMISLKPFMGWGIVSSKAFNPLFKDVHWRLLLAYLMTMTAIWGIAATAVYSFFYHSRSQQLNKQLLTLVQAAAPSLETIKTEGRRSLDKGLAWRGLFFDREQGLEWFDAEGKLLEQEGNHFPKTPLARNVLSSPLNGTAPVFQYDNQIYSVTIAVYTNQPDGKTLQRVGYLRATQSNDLFQASLSQLQLGLGVGGLIALSLASISSLYLTQQAVKPMKQSFQRLTQFAADASHELRNPLLRISIATEMMLGYPEQLKPADMKKLQTILTATEQMKRLIDDVLFLARTDAAQVPLSKQGSDIASLDKILQVLVERFEPQAQVKGIDFQVQLPAS
jgi:signal transduction histidine kinase